MWVLWLLGEYGLDGSENEARELVGFTCQATKWKSLIPCILDYLCSEKRPNVRRHQLPKTKPLPSVESLGPPPTKPQKPPAVNLQAFQRWTAAVPKARRQGRKMHPPRPPPHSRPVGVSAGSSAGRHPQAPPSPPELPGDNAELLLCGWTPITAYSHVEGLAACLPAKRHICRNRPLSLPSQPASPASTAFDHRDSVQEKEQKRRGAGRRSAFVCPTRPVLSTQPVQSAVGGRDRGGRQCELDL